MVPLGERTIAIASGDSSPTGKPPASKWIAPFRWGPDTGTGSGPPTWIKPKQEAAFYYQNDGYYGIEAAEQSGQNSVRLIERGSLVFLHKHLMVSRWLNDSFGVVEVPHPKGRPGVREQSGSWRRPTAGAWL